MVPSIMASSPGPELAKQKTILPWQKNGLKNPQFWGGGGTHLYSLASFVRPGSANNKILVNSYSELKVIGQCARVKQGAVKPATKTKQTLILPVTDRAAHVAVPNLGKKKALYLVI